VPIPPFHLAIPVRDLSRARAFYGGLLGCREGRSSARWVDFDFFGHQLVAQLCEGCAAPPSATNDVDGHAVPVSHFGVVLDWEEFRQLERRLRDLDVGFRIEPYLRFEGRPGEQRTMFLDDPSGNVLEFKAFRDIGRLFAK